jgi:hypothetical protein
VIKHLSDEQGSNDYYNTEAGPVNHSSFVNTESDSKSRANTGQDTEDAGRRLCQGAGEMEKLTICFSPMSLIL